MIEQYISIRLDKPREQIDVDRTKDGIRSDPAGMSHLHDDQILQIEQKEQHRQIGDEKSVLILIKSVDPGCDQCRQDKEDIDQIKSTRLAGTEHQVQHHKSILSRHRTDKREQEKNPIYREKRI